MPERAGREVDAVQLVLGMGAEEGRVAAVALELLAGEAAGGVQRGVQREGRVPLREHEAVAVGVVGRAAEHAEDGGEDLDHGERGADVADARAVGLLEDRPAELRGLHEGGFCRT